MIKLAALLIFGVSFELRADEEKSSIPYNSLNQTMTLLKSQNVDGVECVPFYLKSAKKDEPLDVKQANFRIKTWEGENVSLKANLLSEIPEEKRTNFEKKVVGEGYTHVLWIPKAVKQYLDGDVLHDLPKGSINMTQGLGISGSIDLGTGNKEK